MRSRSVYLSVGAKLLVRKYVLAVVFSDDFLRAYIVIPRLKEDICVMASVNSGEAWEARLSKPRRSSPKLAVIVCNSYFLQSDYPSETLRFFPQALRNSSLTRKDQLRKSLLQNWSFLTRLLPTFCGTRNFGQQRLAKSLASWRLKFD